MARHHPRIRPESPPQLHDRPGLDLRAALELTEAATRIQDGAAGVTDEIWDAVADHFDEKQLSAIILEIALTNFYNRINRTIREQAGKTW